MTEATAKPAEELPVRHAREIQEIIDAHQDLARGIPDGHELVEIRGKCSRAIAETCRRHVAEAAAESMRAAEVAKGEPAAEGDGKPAEPVAALPAPES